MDAGAVTIAITGVLVSGVLGPSVASKMSRSSDDRKAARAIEVADREELRKLLDDAATLLSAGPRLIRMARQAGHRGDAQHALDEWAAAVFPVEQRLRLRLAPSDEVVAAYRLVREDLTKLINVGSQDDPQAPTAAFESSRDAFLEASRNALQISDASR